MFELVRGNSRGSIIIFDALMWNCGGVGDIN